MNRRQLVFLVLLNAVVSLVIALGVVLAFEMRRPDAEELAALNTSSIQPILAASGEPQISTENGTNPDTNAPVSNGGAAPGGAGESTGENGGSTGGTENSTENGAGNNSGNETENGAEAGEQTAAEDEVYVVEAGDSLSTIAGRYNVTIDDIVRANDLANPDSIFSGQRLTIPMQGRQPAAQDTESGAPLGEGVEISQVDDAGELASENVLIVNESNLAFSLLGWRLEREGGPTYTFGNVPLFPGSSVRVHTRAGEDTSIEFFWGEDEAHWQSNTVARLVNAQGIEVNRFTVP